MYCADLLFGPVHDKAGRWPRRVSLLLGSFGEANS
jgi:hypothetical protein